MREHYLSPKGQREKEGKRIVNPLNLLCWSTCLLITSDPRDFSPKVFGT